MKLTTLAGLICFRLTTLEGLMCDKLTTLMFAKWYTHNTGVVYYAVRSEHWTELSSGKRTTLEVSVVS